MFSTLLLLKYHAMIPPVIQALWTEGYLNVRLPSFISTFWLLLDICPLPNIKVWKLIWTDYHIKWNQVNLKQERTAWGPAGNLGFRVYDFLVWGVLGHQTRFPSNNCYLEANLSTITWGFHRFETSVGFCLVRLWPALQITWTDFICHFSHWHTGHICRHDA